MDIEQTDFVEQGLGRLANQYVGKTKLTARLTALLTVAQDFDEVCQDFADALKVTTATGIWLDIIGWMVGVARKLPNGDTLADGPYRFLIYARIARNNCDGTIPDMRAQLRRLFDPYEFGMDVHVQDVGGMSIHAQIGRLITDDEKSVLQITSGISQIAGGILPKPSGVMLSLSERLETDFFCFSNPSTPGVPNITGGMGFSDPISPSGTWASGVL